MDSTVTQWFDDVPVRDGRYEVRHQMGKQIPDVLLMHNFEDGRFFPALAKDGAYYNYIPSFGDQWRGLANNGDSNG